MGGDSEPWVFKGGLSGDVQVFNMLILVKPVFLPC